MFKFILVEGEYFLIMTYCFGKPSQILYVLFGYIPSFIQNIFTGVYSVPGTVLITTEYNNGHFRRKEKIN
jgi:hypothetical protein